jgi:hypothetical protein
MRHMVVVRKGDNSYNSDNTVGNSLLEYNSFQFVTL